MQIKKVHISGVEIIPKRRRTIANDNVLIWKRKLVPKNPLQYCT